MAKKAFEMSFQIGGKLASSFSSVFSRASTSLSDLKNQSRQTQRALDQLGSDFRRGKIHQSQYAESTEKLTRELEQLERAQNRISAMNTTLGNGFNTLRTTASLAAVGSAAAATGLALNSLSTAGNFEQQMTKVGVIASASEAEMKRLNETAVKLGASSSLSATEVAVAMKELASKGMDTNKIIGAMPGILAAAEASGEDLALTSSVVTSAINAFELKATEASRVADIMAMSANRTAAGVEDLGYSFKYAAPVAKTLGLSLEGLAAATGIMVDKGLTGEQAGTSLRMALVRLSDPPREASKALDKLNLTVTDSQGKFKSLAEIAASWNKATAKLTQTQKVQYAATVFGTEAATGMLNLFAAGPKKINEMTKALENSEGSAMAAAKAMKNNYAGSLEELSGSIESAKIKFMTPVLPVFQDVFDGMSSVIDGNSNKLEQKGKKLAENLRDIFDPFSTVNPIKPKFSDVGNTHLYQEAMSQYQVDLAKFEKFKSMDFGDKVVYSLDQATVKIEKWLSGSGGESMNKIFSKLGEIAAKAWMGAFTSTVSSAGSNLMQGNVGAAAGLGTAAWLMGGGLLVRGAIGAGKWGIDKAKGLASKGSAGTSKVTPVVTSKSAPTPPSKTSNVVPFAKPKTTSTVSTVSKTDIAKSVLGKSAKVLGKVALPVTVVAEGYNIYKAKDKTKASVQAGGGIAGGLGGAKIGAAIGTVIAPGIGTAIGAAIGGIGGSIAGHFLAGKAVDHTRNVSQPQQQKYAAPPPTKVSSIPTAELTKAATDLKNSIDKNIHNFNVLLSFTGQASGWIVGSFTGIKTSAEKVTGNLDILTMYTGQASGWLASLNGIQTAGQRVVKALDQLEERINNVQLPSMKGRRVSYDG